MFSDEFDVVIAGGGVMGSACAYFLCAEPSFRGSIAVVEPDPSYRQAASSLSASSIRQQFSSPINIALSAFGMDFLRKALPRPPHAPAPFTARSIGLVESSYLYLATPAGTPFLERRMAIQRQADVPVRLHDRSGLSALYPWLNTEDLGSGSDTIGVEGWFDGHSLLSALRSANVAGGVHYLRDRVIGFEQSDDRRIAAVSLKERGRLGCGTLVMAAGTRSRDLAASLNMDLPVFAKKRHVFVFTCPETIPRCPLVIDPSGLWFRPEGDRYLCGIPAEPDPDVPLDDFEFDPSLFESQAWPVLAHRVPAFEALRLSSGWVGHYDYNKFDQNAFVGPVAGISNLLLASGFSGHGLQQAPGVGRGLAEYIAFGEFRSLDLTPLSHARYSAGAPLRELNII